MIYAFQLREPSSEWLMWLATSIYRQIHGPPCGLEWVPMGLRWVLGEALWDTLWFQGLERGLIVVKMRFDGGCFGFFAASHNAQVRKRGVLRVDGCGKGGF